MSNHRASNGLTEKRTVGHLLAVRSEAGNSAIITFPFTPAVTICRVYPLRARLALLSETATCSQRPHVFNKKRARIDQDGFPACNPVAGAPRKRSGASCGGRRLENRRSARATKGWNGADCLRGGD